MFIMIRKLQKTDIDRAATIWLDSNLKALDFIKDKKEMLCLNVYQKNMRAICFYQREGFEIQGESLDETTNEKDYVMIWEGKRNA